MLELSFRYATKKDMSICAEIISESEAWQMYGINYDKAYELLSAMEDRIYIAEDHSNIIGFITLRADGMGNFGSYIRMLAVKEDYRNNGVGRQLISFIQSVAKKHNGNIFLICSTSNSKAANFYETMGFEKVGLLKDLLAEGDDEILFRKTI